MTAIALNNDLVNVARLFGDVNLVISDAVRRYAIEQSVGRIESARLQIRAYEKKYGVDYKRFARKVQTDSKFLHRVQVKNPVWEEDASEWKYRIEEAQEWTATLERILNQ